MNEYGELDRRILKAIEAQKKPLYNNHVSEEAQRIASATGRKEFRVIDGRLKALRKEGKIFHCSKAKSNGRGGWNLAYPRLEDDGVRLERDKEGTQVRLLTAECEELRAALLAGDGNER